MIYFIHPTVSIADNDMNYRYVFCCLWLVLSTPIHAVSPIRMALPFAPISLDARIASDATSERIQHVLYRRLLDVRSDGHLQADLADWQVLDPLHYRFTLKAQLPVFHHGKALTATDVKATYDSLKSLPNALHSTGLSAIHSITVENPRQLVFQLKTPDKHFLEYLTVGICPHDLLQAGHDFNRHPVGNGALRLLAWHKTLQLIRIRDGQTLVLEVVKDPSVRALKLIRGEVDLLSGDLPAELLHYLSQQKGIHVYSTVGSNFSYLGVSLRDTSLRQQQVRQALAYAIDIPAILRQVLVPMSRQAHAILPPEHRTRTAHTDLRYGYNPELAKRLLQQAHIKLPLHLEYKTSTDAQKLRLAIILQAQMRRAGIELTIRSLDWASFFADIQQGHFQLFSLTWVGVKTPHIYEQVFKSDQVPPRGFNRGYYQNQRMDELLAQENWHDVVRLAQQDLPYIPLWHEGQFVALRDNLQHYAAKADGNWDDLATITRNTH